MGFSTGTRSVFALVLAVGALGLATTAKADVSAGDPARGQKVAYTCLGCHGIPDYRNAYPNYHVPKLGGQHAGYMVAALTGYRAGARPHPTMRGQATSVSEQDIRDVAAYFSSATPVASSGKGATGTAPAAAATCAACHGPDGVGITADFPTLAGQHADYIEQALKAYRSGKRQNAVMNPMAAALKDDEIHALALYFSQQTPSLWVPLPPKTASTR